MKGDGAIDNPWVPNTVQEFRTACSQQGYVKLEKDLDCNQDGYYEWTTLIVMANEVDFNGFALKNILAAGGGYAFQGSTQRITRLRNGKILNVFENGAICIFINIEINNMTISANCNNITSNFSRNCNIHFSNIYIKRNANYKGTMLSGNIQNSRIELDATFWGTHDAYTNSIVSGGEFKDSLITGNVSVDNTLIKILETNSYFTNSICNLSTNGKGIWIGGTGLLNTSFISENKLDSSTIKLVTDEQLRNPDYLNSIGFNVVKV